MERDIRKIGFISGQAGSHGELVTEFRKYATDQKQDFAASGIKIPEVRILTDRLASETRMGGVLERVVPEGNVALSDRTESGDFYLPIYHAWLVITYDHNSKLNRATALHETAHILSRRFKTAQHVPDQEPETIKLNPLQAEILNAMAESIGIDHEEVKDEVKIPEKFRDYDKWKVLGEYEDAVKRAGREDLA